MTNRFRTIGVDGLLCAALGLVALAGASCTNWAKVESAYHQARDLPYIHDEGDDYWQSPAETTARGAGDCEDKAIYLHHLLRERGIDSKVVFGIQNVLRPKVGHAWVECQVDGSMQVLDPTGRLLIARAKLSTWEYYPVRASSRIRAMMRQYLSRPGVGGVNSDYGPSSAYGGETADADDDFMLIWMLSVTGGADRQADGLSRKQPRKPSKSGQPHVERE